MMKEFDCLDKNKVIPRINIKKMDSMISMLKNENYVDLGTFAKIFCNFLERRKNEEKSKRNELTDHKSKIIKFLKTIHRIKRN